MQPNNLIPQQFADFQPTYISSLAQQNTLTYIQESLGDGKESSLYNNPKTNTTELYKLKLNVSGLQCEYYTADFTPLIYRDMPISMVSNYSTTSVQVPTRLQVQVFSIDLTYAVENLYVESRTNITLNNILGLKSVVFKDSETVQLEGDFSYFFRAYVPKNEKINAFTILAPNIMSHLLADGGDYDFEFSGSKIYFYKTFALIQSGTIPLKKAEYDQMLKFGIKSATLLARASRPAKLASNTDTPEMWQLYGMSKARLTTIFTLMTVGFLLLASCLLNPLLWPLGGVVAFIFYRKRRRLLTKREKLIKEWQTTSQ